MIAVQPDLTGHKSEPVKSLRLPEFCAAEDFDYGGSGYWKGWSRKRLSFAWFCAERDTACGGCWKASFASLKEEVCVSVRA